VRDGPLQEGNRRVATAARANRLTTGMYCGTVESAPVAEEDKLKMFSVQR
jgi:hypothetical protein